MLMCDAWLYACQGSAGSTASCRKIEELLSLNTGDGEAVRETYRK